VEVSIVAGIILYILNAAVDGFGDKAVIAIVNGWVWLYTRGLLPGRQLSRREQIRSDIWEQREEALAAGYSVRAFAIQAYLRLIFGVPSDVSWWFAHVRLLERLPWRRSKAYWEARRVMASMSDIQILLAQGVPAQPLVIEALDRLDEHYRKVRSASDYRSIDPTVRTQFEIMARNLATDLRVATVRIQANVDALKAIGDGQRAQIAEMTAKTAELWAEAAELTAKAAQWRSEGLRAVHDARTKLAQVEKERPGVLDSAKIAEIEIDLRQAEDKLLHLDSAREAENPRQDI
jgi:hypothetical protein